MTVQIGGNRRTCTGTDRYNALAAGLHWLIAILMFVQIYVGWTFGAMDRGLARDLWFDWHQTLGFTILILSLVRLGCGIANPRHALPAAMPRWKRIAAGLSHLAFHVILIGLPLT